MTIRFQLNPKNSKDKAIIDFLSQEYSANETVKAILYKMATMGNCSQLTSMLAEELVTSDVNDSQLTSTVVNDSHLENIPKMPTDARSGQPKSAQEMPTNVSGGQIDEDILKFFN